MTVKKSMLSFIEDLNIQYSAFDNLSKGLLSGL